MHLHLWAISIVGAIASSIPVATSHEIHLPYLPSAGPDKPADSYLSVKWSIANGSLYANQDRIFPPAMSMKLHAPRYENSQKPRADAEDLELSFSLDARPLPIETPGSSRGLVRVSVEVLDIRGEPVTSHAVMLDLLSYPDDSARITRIRMIPGQAHPDFSAGERRPWQMKFWQSQLASIFPHPEDKQGSANDSPSATEAVEPSHAEAADSRASGAVDSRVGYFFSPYWVPGASSHNPHRRPHGGRHRNNFIRVMRPVVLPAFLGAVAGLVACLVGFVIGHICMSLSVRLGLRQKPQRRRSRASRVEEGTSEKSHLVVPEVYVTNPDA
ncbi:uncharacterized protein N7459_000042 [Penicillium hispanicum]|uniref:uncharacterized protein n=1 Tax=Penicillium hispanicum TaxID=1080232 RepID=UPI002541603C|nr:uncharacterized protein N7459_000042 [Penicillium hispanicum]KAJ5593834.1 hypothetical protein N7459_000042 [Penicillium hispanicum]